jgi:Kef-type K+ transport system membrane component KefB
MGIQVRLETLADSSVIGLALGLTVAAIIGKQVCGLAVVEKRLDRLSIGVGMIPRGEVGLIFAGIGKALNIVDGALYSAIVIMVILTTLITPPVLKFTLLRRSGSVE